MENIFVDTSGWVALFVENDKNHEKAAAIFDELKNLKANIYTSDYVIDETITTILSRGNHAKSVIAGNAILTSKIIKIVSVSPVYLHKAWEQYQKYKDKTFSFTDVTSFTIMDNLTLKKAFAFDKHFTEAGIELVR